MLSELTRANLEEAARAIYGQPVIVTCRRPPMRGALAEAYKDSNGVAFIDLSPDLEPERAWPIFLHELAHAKLHLARVPATPYQAMSSGAIPPAPPSDELVKRILAEREAEADSLAETWQAWTAQKAKSVIKPADSWPVRIAIYASYLKYWKP